MSAFCLRGGAGGFGGSAGAASASGMGTCDAGWDFTGGGGVLGGAFVSGIGLAAGAAVIGAAAWALRLAHPFNKIARTHAATLAAMAQLPAGVPGRLQSVEASQIGLGIYFFPWANGWL